MEFLLLTIMGPSIGIGSFLGGMVIDRLLSFTKIIINDDLINNILSDKNIFILSGLSFTFGFLSFSYVIKKIHNNMYLNDENKIEKHKKINNSAIIFVNSIRGTIAIGFSFGIIITRLGEIMSLYIIKKYLEYYNK